jgi:hypothetical protein
MVLIIVRLQLMIEVREDTPLDCRRLFADDTLIVADWQLLLYLTVSQCSIMEGSVQHLVLRSESVKCKTQLPTSNGARDVGGKEALDVHRALLLRLNHPLHAAYA